MDTAFNLYKNSCKCGKAFDNNCAHYLSNAMIQAGFKLENYPGFTVCQKGRPIRASQMKIWFQQHSTDDNQFPVLGRVYGCYQQKEGWIYSLSKNIGLQNEKGHVFLKRYIKQGAKTVEDIRGTMGSVQGYTQEKLYYISNLFVDLFDLQFTQCTCKHIASVLNQQRNTKWKIATPHFNFPLQFKGL